MINLIPVVNTSGNKVFINTEYIWLVWLLKEPEDEPKVYKWIMRLDDRVPVNSIDRTFYSPDFATMEGAALWLEEIRRNMNER